MKVLVYVEGPSDQDGLRAVLRNLIDQGKRNGVGISFHHLGSKSRLLSKVGRRAAHYLSENPGDWIFALPDLYPCEPSVAHSNRHTSSEELKGLLQRSFSQSANELGLEPPARTHFRTHCLKHDFEALLLAAPAALRQRLHTNDRLGNNWRMPVEDQNDTDPPKRVIERLFKKYQHRQYVDTIDARAILEQTSLDEIKNACRQCFEPFVGELEKLASGQSL